MSYTINLTLVNYVEMTFQADLCLRLWIQQNCNNHTPEQCSRLWRSWLPHSAAEDFVNTGRISPCSMQGGTFCH